MELLIPRHLWFSHFGLFALWRRQNYSGKLFIYTHLALIGLLVL